MSIMNAGPLPSTKYLIRPVASSPHAAYDHILFEYSEFNHPKYYLKLNKKKSVNTWFVAIIELINLRLKEWPY